MNILVLFFFSLAGLASPQKGERAVLTGFYNGKPVKLYRENLGQKDGNWLVKTDTYFEGKTSSQTVLVPLITSQRILKLVNECYRFNGVTEEISVKAGKFLTCKLFSEREGATVWSGDVPFGVVKKEIRSTAVETYELESFERK